MADRATFIGLLSVNLLHRFEFYEFWKSQKGT